MTIEPTFLTMEQAANRLHYKGPNGMSTANGIAITILAALAQGPAQCICSPMVDKISFHTAHLPPADVVMLMWDLDNAAPNAKARTTCGNPYCMNPYHLEWGYLKHIRSANRLWSALNARHRYVNRLRAKQFEIDNPTT